MANEELSNPSEDDIHFTRWLLAGYLLLSSAQSLTPDDWDGLSYSAFKTQLRNTYADTIRNWLTSYHIPWLESRGISVGISSTPTELTNFINKAINDTPDLHRSAQSSFSTGTFDQWGSPTHQGQILLDLARISGDHLEEAVTTRLQETGLLTGKKRWRTAGPDSRHSELDMQTTGDTWIFAGQPITRPRFNPQNPKLWSSCACTLDFEWRDSDGNTGWL